MNIPIEKKVLLNVKPEEMALTINTYLHKLFLFPSQQGIYKTLNFTVRKDGRNFNLIIIACRTALSKKQVVAAVNEVLITL